MRGRLSILAVVLASVLIAPATSGQPPGSLPTMRVHAIDVGQGAATLLEFPCAAVLIDTGGEDNGQFKSREALIDYLDTFFEGRPDLNKTFASLMLTHPHIDHTNGVPVVLEKYTVKNAVTNGQEKGSGRFQQRALHRKIESDGLGFTFVHVADLPPQKGLTSPAIDPVNCPNVVDPEIVALWGTVVGKPANWSADDFGDQNNHSVVIRVNFGGASLLVPGDLEIPAIRDMITRYQGTDILNVDVYHVGHHGSANGTTHDLLNAMTPKIALMGTGPFDRQIPYTAWEYGHPRKVIVDLLLSHVSEGRPTKSVRVATGKKTFVPATISKAIYATGWDGTVVLEADTNGTWKVLDSTVPAAPASLVNINTASAEQLTTLPMIGNTRARAIVQDRAVNGRFNTVNDLSRVQGIGPATINAIRNFVTTGG